MRTPISLRQGSATLSEVLQYVTQHKDVPARIAALRENDTKAMRDFCRIAYGSGDPFEDMKKVGFAPKFRCRLETLESTESFYDLVQTLLRVTDKARAMVSRQDALNDLLEWLSTKEAKIILSIFNRKTEIPGFEVVVRAVYKDLG